MILNILHISDLHFTSDDDSYLRDNQKVFIDELVSEIKSVESQVDYLFLTGDFVERSSWNENSRIKDIINNLESSLKIKKTFCVNGNHDLDKKGFAAKEFDIFKKSLKTSESLIKTDWFKAYQIYDKHWVFEFDCFSNGKLTDKISDVRNFKPLKSSQLEEFKDFVTNKLTGNKQNLFLLSHLPVEINPNSVLSKNFDWKEKHIWKDGENILEFLKKHIDVNILLWFAGDGHIVESYKPAELPYYFFLTGRFNGPIEKYGLNREKEILKEASCQFIRVDTVKGSVVRTIKLSTFREGYNKESLKWYSKSLGFISSTKYLNNLFSRNEKQKTLNREITKAISESNLYELSKTITKHKNVSIGYIDINGLMNHDNILKQFLECTSELLDSEYSYGFENMIILGLGYWGASIASFISLNKNIPMKSIKVRGCDIKEHTSLAKFIANKKVIVSTDVVSSGETLDEIREVLKIKDFSCLITVILNPYIISRLKGIDRIIYGSNQIALPILEREHLPDSILESKYDFDKI